MSYINHFELTILASQIVDCRIYLERTRERYQDGKLSKSELVERHIIKERYIKELPSKAREIYKHHVLGCYEAGELFDEMIERIYNERKARKKKFKLVRTA